MRNLRKACAQPREVLHTKSDPLRARQGRPGSDIRGVTCGQLEPGSGVGDRGHYLDVRSVHTTAIMDLDIDAVMDGRRRHVCPHAIAAIHDDFVEGEEVYRRRRRLIAGVPNRLQ